MQRRFFSSLRAISPVDGRYSKACDPLRDYFSEYALMKYRIYVEIQWFKKLFHNGIIQSNSRNLKDIIVKEDAFLEDLCKNFNLENAEWIKESERVTNHDVKAVEYYLKHRFGENENLEEFKEYLHFSCTSEDINNLSYALMLRDSLQKLIFPKLEEILEELTTMSEQYADIPIMCRTHGQSATPSTVGKELANFVFRISRQLEMCKSVKILGKFNGATGNLNAHTVAFPEKDWLEISQDFVEGLDISWNPYTTQIEPHDSLANLCVLLSVLNTQVLDFSRDMWSYISLGYFRQKAVAGEIGSSTMPHKINPIDFENAEGNLGLANASLIHFATKLPISRFQRDLSDSTVLRNVGSAFANCLQAYGSVLKGLRRIDVNEELLRAELENHYELLAEPVQTVMRRYEMKDPYEQLKEFTRGKTVTVEDFHRFIQSLELPDDEKSRLMKLTPATYLGLAPQLASSVRELASGSSNATK